MYVFVHIICIPEGKAKFPEKNNNNQNKSNNLLSDKSKV